VLLGVLVVGFVLMKLVGSAGSGGPSSNLSTAARADTAASQPATGGRGGPVDPERLNVHLEALEADRPATGETERNPFRVRPAPPPPPPPVISVPLKPDGANAGPITPPGPPHPPPAPPITVKFIGVLDLNDGSKIAVFADCSAGRRQAQAREGGIIDGRYRLVKIGVQSVIIEHLDGRGRTTLAQGGQECVK
jgi:hypothetical protein